MNRDDIIRMALEAGFTLCRRHEWVPRNEFAMVDENVDGDLACLIQFAALVAAAERDRMCEQFNIPKELAHEKATGNEAD